MIIITKMKDMLNIMSQIKKTKNIIMRQVIVISLLNKKMEILKACLNIMWNIIEEIRPFIKKIIMNTMKKIVENMKMKKEIMTKCIMKMMKNMSRVKLMSNHHLKKIISNIKTLINIMSHKIIEKINKKI